MKMTLNRGYVILSHSNSRTNKLKSFCINKMETVPCENKIPVVATPVAVATPLIGETTATVAIPAAVVVAAPVLGMEVPVADEEEEAADEEMEAGYNTRKSSKKVEEEYQEEEEEEIEEEEEDEWVSDHETKQKRRGRKAHMSESEDDEDYGRSKKRRIVPEKKTPRAKVIIASESAGMKALRSYTSALKLGPRCFRNLNKISSPKEREAQLIKRLNDCGRTWSGEYPTARDIMVARDETLSKKAEKARQFILEEESADGVRTSRRAAQKARDFVKTLGEEDDDDDDEVDDADIEVDDVDMDDNKDDE